MANFLDPELADEMGLVAIGGDLAPTRLVEAYCSGIFPWFDEGGPVLWWSPDPRAIFEMDGLHVSRRLERTLRSGKFHCTIDQAFDKDRGRLASPGERPVGAGPNPVAEEGAFLTFDPLAEEPR